MWKSETTTNKLGETLKENKDNHRGGKNIFNTNMTYTLRELKQDTTNMKQEESTIIKRHDQRTRRTLGN